ncbi:MAG: serine/threonine protein kinase, partial [Nostocales cyanobacterium]
LYDMHGNVWEWCEDVWRRNYDNAPTDGSAFLSRTRGDMKVIRGGSWRIIPHYCRSAKRSRCGKEFKDNELGFRVVLSEMP